MFYVLFVGFMVCTMLLCSLYALFLVSTSKLNAMHFPFKYCHSYALVGLFLDAYTYCIMHWLSVGMQVICIELICLYVQVFIPSVNEHGDHYLIVIACLIKPLFIS